MLAALPGPALAADGDYAYEAGARPVPAAKSTDTAAQLRPGSTYRSSITVGADGSGRAYYRVRLDATSNAYVSVTAVPPIGQKIAYDDGIRVWMQSADRTPICSGDPATFGAGENLRPIVATGSRIIDSAPLCPNAGTYYVMVERTSGKHSSHDAWGLELRYSAEPSLKGTEAGEEPEVWNSATPKLPRGKQQGSRKRSGGAGFGSAVAVETGSFRGSVTPGRTRYYRVPVDWGQQVYAEAELGGTNGAVDANSFDGVMLSLHNPARTLVVERGTSYTGSSRSVALDPLPPVDYRNRFAARTERAAMRFAGWYYLAVSVAPDVGLKFGKGPYALTLRVKVSGRAKSGPLYNGKPVPAAAFGVTDRDREAAANGDSADAGAGATKPDGAMRTLAVAAFGAGLTLVLVLGGWTVLARRRATR
ncbi:hypothetical protein [Streptomyces sp. NPDC058045]|uniref:hypothetical protein n=1 Tax=Streptomyces sp. NPDC058045 TaxID=3346311 RepID=UPI0036E0452E